MQEVRKIQCSKLTTEKKKWLHSKKKEREKPNRILLYLRQKENKSIINSKDRKLFF